MGIPKGIKQVISTYGNPKTILGKLNPNWYSANIVKMDLPYPMRIAWNTSQIVKEISIHKLCADSLQAALLDIWNHVRLDMKKQHGYKESSEFYDQKALDYLHLHGLDLFGGSYNFRKQIGGNELSMHAYGCAIDIDPEHNALGKRGRMPMWIVEIMESHGWMWGGRFKRKDPMHFERCIS